MAGFRLERLQALVVRGCFEEVKGSLNTCVIRVKFLVNGCHLLLIKRIEWRQVPCGAAMNHKSHFKTDFIMIVTLFTLVNQCSVLLSSNVLFLREERSCVSINLTVLLVY
jgi:hypothetical protein